MVPPADNITETPRESSLRGWRFWLSRLMLVFVVALLAVVAFGWIQREQIARDLIGEQLKQAGIEARYTVEDIDPDRQVLTNISIGDPARPDLTIEKAVVELAYGFGVPEIGRITLVKPRLYGSLRDGKISFGALDPLTRDNLGQACRQLHDRLGLTTLMVTHDIQEALVLANRIVVMEGGRVVTDATPTQILQSETSGSALTQMFWRQWQRMGELAAQGRAATTQSDVSNIRVAGDE